MKKNKLEKRDKWVDEMRKKEKNTNWKATAKSVSTVVKRSKKKWRHKHKESTVPHCTRNQNRAKKIWF